MRLHDLKPAAGAHKERKRLGRGNATGQGTTAGKGTKGEKARSGGLKAGFRGMSSRNARTAKRRGFNNRFKTEYQIVKLEQLSGFVAGARIDAAALQEAGLIRNPEKPIKVLGNGDVSAALNLVDVRITRSARMKIEAAGGSVTSVQPVDASTEGDETAEEDPSGTGSA
jgi:large subunit ribosomal protein L15